VNVVHKEGVVHETSATSQPKTRRRQVSEERILEAATQMVLAQGYDGLNMKDVADAADYTPGALYRYFPSKSALLAAVVVRLLGHLSDELSELEGATGPRTALARVVALGFGYRRFALTQPHAFALFSAMLADPRVLLPEAHERATIVMAMHRTLMPLARQLDRAVEAGELPPGATDTRALMIFTSLHGALQLGKQERLAILPIATDALVQSLLEALLVGLGAARETVSAALDEGRALLTHTPQVVP
jgi:AcrR family transcriptional regulator